MYILNMTTKNPNKSPKNKVTPIKDISKSQLLIIANISENSWK